MNVQDHFFAEHPGQQACKNKKIRHVMDMYDIEFMPKKQVIAFTKGKKNKHHV
jgi:hypothetical protein